MMIRWSEVKERKGFFYRNKRIKKINHDDTTATGLDEKRRANGRHWVLAKKKWFRSLPTYSTRIAHDAGTGAEVPTLTQEKNDATDWSSGNYAGWNGIASVLSHSLMPQAQAFSSSSLIGIKGEPLVPFFPIINPTSLTHSQQQQPLQARTHYSTLTFSTPKKIF